MIDILLTAVLPVFALLAIGYFLGRAGVFDQAMASAINRFVFLVSIPALVFGLLARSPFDQFNWLAVGAFATIEVIMYGTGFLVARHVFKRDPRESLLIGLAAPFANHLLFVLPIAITLFGENAAIPIVAIATVDALFIYGGTIIILDATSEADVSVSHVLLVFLKNPQIWAIVGGLAVGISGLGMAEGVYVFTKFAGGTAAPCSLFALGIILSRQESGAEFLLPLTISGLKLIVFPLLCWGILFGALGIQLDWAKPAMIVAAAPSSSMAFVLALNYKIPTKTIARIILITMIGSLLTVTFSANI